MRGLVQATVAVVLLSGCDSHHVSSKQPADGPISSSHTPTHAAVASEPCDRVVFNHRPYLLTRHPRGTGVGRILGLGRTVGCHGTTERTLRIYSVNEESPARAITISQDGKVLLYIHR